MKIGISSYSYTWSLGISGYNYQPVMDVFSLVERCYKHQVSLLQIADNTPLHQLSPLDLNRLVKLCRDREIKIEVGSRGLTAENLERYINIATAFGSEILRFVIDNKTEGYEPDIFEISRIIKPKLNELKKLGITLAIENHDRFRAIEFEQLIKELNSPQVGICLDFANSLGAAEGIYETVRVLAPYTVNLHLKDIIIKRKTHNMGFDIEGVPFGKGIIPLPYILKTMPRKCKTAILELWMPPQNSWDDTFEQEDYWVKMSIDYLKSLDLDNDK